MAEKSTVAELQEGAWEPDFQRKDPFPDVHGVLLADYIKYYSQKLRMIEKFKEEHLQAASYELHVGNEFYIDNKPIKPDTNNQVVIPKNGLLYFSLEETLNLPPYIIACHDLRVKQVYRGLLVGRSVHVAPGYSGLINYPIFNFTSQDRTLTVGEPIGTIIFIKTTPFGAASFWSSNKGGKVLRTDRVKGVEDNVCIQEEKRDNRGIPSYWRGGETHSSAVFHLQTGFNELRDEHEEFRKSIDGRVGELRGEHKEFRKSIERKIERITNINYVGLIALALTAVFGIFVEMRWVFDRYDGLTGRAAAVEKRADAVEKHADAVEKRSEDTSQKAEQDVAKLNAKVADLEAQIGRLAQPAQTNAPRGKHP